MKINRKKVQAILVELGKMDSKKYTQANGDLDVRGWNASPEVREAVKKMKDLGVTKEWLMDNFVTAGMLITFQETNKMTNKQDAWKQAEEATKISERLQEEQMGTAKLMTCWNCGEQSTQFKRWYHGDQDDLICLDCSKKLDHNDTAYAGLSVDKTMDIEAVENTLNEIDAAIEHEESEFEQDWEEKK